MMSSLSVPIEKTAYTAYRYQAKCPKCKRIIKGPNQKLTEKNVVDHLGKHDREAEAGRKWYEQYTAKIEA